MTGFATIIAVSIVIQALTEYLKAGIPALCEKTWVVMIITAVLGIALAITFNIDIFVMCGCGDPTIPYVGNVVTGLVCSGGSNIIYDILKRIKESPYVDDESEG